MKNMEPASGYAPALNGSRPLVLLSHPAGKIQKIVNQNNDHHTAARRNRHSANKANPVAGVLSVRVMRTIMWTKYPGVKT